MASGRGMRGGAGAEKEGKGEREKVGAKVEEEENYFPNVIHPYFPYYHRPHH